MCCFQPVFTGTSHLFKFIGVSAAAGQQQGQLASWCWRLAGGLAVVSEEGRVSQLRQEALEAIKLALSTAGAGAPAAAAGGAEVATGVLQHVEGLLAHEPSAAIRAVAGEVKALLGAAAFAMDTS